MKRIAIGIIALIFLSTCKKEMKECTRYTQITKYDHLVDISYLKKFPEIYDTITKYQLQVYRVADDKYQYGFKSYVIYKHLMVFSQQYFLYKGKIDKQFLVIGQPTIDSVSFSLSPTIGYRSAIDLAKSKVNFRQKCISYHLGILDINKGISNATVDHKLVWKVEADGGCPYVILDANTAQVYSIDDCM